MSIGRTFERREFYRLWKECGFDLSKRNDCLEKAGYAKSTIKNQGKKIALPIQEMVIRRMEDRGLSLDKVVDTHKDALGALDPKYGQPDHRARLKAADMYYNLRGAYPSTKVDISQRKEISVEISVDTLRQAEIASGEEIIDVLPEDAIEEVDETRLLEEGHG